MTKPDILNLLNPDGWAKYLAPGSVDALLAEHVWEHLTVEEGLIAAQTCIVYLKPNGYLRIGVPDGLHPDPDYIDWVRVGGSGAGAEDHRVLYTYRTLRSLLEEAGFAVTLLEYFDEEGHFHYIPWETSGGTIRRSSRFDERNENGQLTYTSIVLDAVKTDIRASD